MLLRRDRAMVAIAIMLDVAFHAGQGATVSAAEIADRMGLARRGIEPVLQALTRAGLLESLRGPRGGYRLGRPRRDIRLIQIVEALGDAAPAGAADGEPAGGLQTAVLNPLWGQLETIVRDCLGGLTVDDLIKRAMAAGLPRPAAEPLNFAI